MFLLCGYIAACVSWLEGKYRELQPYVIATLMVIIGFFAVLMLFAANPFETTIAGARLDGEGLNPLLHNYYMIIHPPSLYMGFVGCSVPFAFAIAALVTGRLDNEWIVAIRKWMLFAWMFLSIGNVLGMLWAYEELGWGGYWAWDPVENAACLPWFTASAYVHSTMIQERRDMLKVWNVFLICLTFFLTIFGTFLTRSGLIASVHCFAQSDIGIYFVCFMGVIVAACVGLIVWRLPLLRPQGRIEIARSVARRRSSSTTGRCSGRCPSSPSPPCGPLVTRALPGEKVTVGPPFYNRWMAPIGIVILALMGAGAAVRLAQDQRGFAEARRHGCRRSSWPSRWCCIWRSASGSASPPTWSIRRRYRGIVGTIVQQIAAIAPLITIALVAFNFAVVDQEFERGVKRAGRTPPRASSRR